MLRLLRFNLTIFMIAFFLVSCVTTRDCKVKNSKQKWKYYNNLQFGAAPKKRR